MSRTDSPSKQVSIQMKKSTKLHPSWLKTSSSKTLPGIYQGVLGQVQVQPSYPNHEKQTSRGYMFSIRQQNKQIDYMDRFTDTERVHQLLAASNLPTDILTAVWNHVNQTFPGKLTNREVCLALALIAIFQRPNLDLKLIQHKDFFSLVRLEKIPPVPTLYPDTDVNLSARSKNATFKSGIKCQLVSDSLIDIGDDSNFFRSPIDNSGSGLTKTPDCSKDQTNLIDTDGDRIEINFLKLKLAWTMFLEAIRKLLKRSFDILNVENSRRSAMEALRHPSGVEFSKLLCLCYPLAHNIKYKIDELTTMNRKSTADLGCRRQVLFDEVYILQINDLMNSINEYWAVLINLLNEAGQTKFIELIMDGLNYQNCTLASQTNEELIIGLDALDKPDVCCICHTKFFLTKIDSKSLLEDDLGLVQDEKELLSEDKHYYYHAKCANFWLNNVDSSQLPFREDVILRPAPY